jgi:tRNA wybutosine-synthesizing protein 2
MGFKEKLKAKLEGIISSKELELLPRGFQTLGKVMILKLHPDLIKHKEAIARKSMELLPAIESVYLNKGIIKGDFRTPENIEYLAGKENSIVIHKEHGVSYKFDFTRIMFSQGNLAERKYLATLVKDGEVVVDMFAGIGYFSLPIAKIANPRKIYSIELNPFSFKFLSENIKLNRLEDKITPVNGDCKEEVLKLSESGVRADRVIMGVFPAPKEYIREALTLIKETGTYYHYEGVVDKNNYLSLYQEFEEVVEDNHMRSKLVDKRFVKSYGPNLYHVVLDIYVS